LSRALDANLSLEACYEDFHDEYNQIGRFIDEVYMRRRIHSSLGWQRRPSMNRSDGSDRSQHLLKNG
jgi:hypothetical protein